DGPVWMVATASDGSSTADLPFRQLLHYFDISIALPPLHCRTDDLPALTAALLRGIAPERHVRMSPEAMRLIARYSWPRNISQLREALVHAVRRRPVGEIQATDLPGYCQTVARHTLTPLEGAERDVIVAALQESGGNRMAAATHLGMSRSSL
ncbi:helix-turn-helix domain-containing protein, partial [Streptomyces sp. DSM 41634]